MKATQPASPSSTNFVLDVEGIRTRAREQPLDGAQTSDSTEKRGVILRLLDGALATEMVCVMRYRRHYFMSANLGGIDGFAVKDEFLTHSKEEQAHADLLAERIVQLGGEPDFDPSTLSKRSHADYVAGTDLAGMLREDLVAERIAIESYRQMVRFIGDSDPTTRRMLEGILEKEEEHADELADLLRRNGKLSAIK